MKKVIIILAALALVAFGALITLIITMQIGQHPDANDIPQAAIQSGTHVDLAVELAAEIAELESMLQAILTGETPFGTSNTPTITSQDARDIALAFVGYGEVFDDLLFIDYGVFIFEVDIRYEAARYMIYVNAIDGSVMNMSQYDDNIFP